MAKKIDLKDIVLFDCPKTQELLALGSEPSPAELQLMEVVRDTSLLLEHEEQKVTESGVPLIAVIKGKRPEYCGVISKKPTVKAKT